MKEIKYKIRTSVDVCNILVGSKRWPLCMTLLLSFCYFWGICISFMVVTFLSFFFFDFVFQNWEMMSYGLEKYGEGWREFSSLSCGVDWHTYISTQVRDRRLNKPFNFFLRLYSIYQGPGIFYVAEVDSTRSWFFFLLWKLLQQGPGLFSGAVITSTRSRFFKMAWDISISPWIFSTAWRWLTGSVDIFWGH